MLLIKNTINNSKSLNIKNCTKVEGLSFPSLSLYMVKIMEKMLMLYHQEMFHNQRALKVTWLQVNLMVLKMSLPLNSQQRKSHRHVQSNLRM